MHHLCTSLFKGHLFQRKPRNKQYLLIPWTFIDSSYKARTERPTRYIYFKVYFHNLTNSIFTFNIAVKHHLTAVKFLKTYHDSMKTKLKLDTFCYPTKLIIDLNNVWSPKLPSCENKLIEKLSSSISDVLPLPF